MPQLLPRRRRRTRPAQIHPPKPTHQIRHPTTTTHRHRRGSTRRRRGIKQTHDIRHPPTRRHTPRNRTRHPIRRARPSRILLRTSRRSPVKVDIQQILDIALLRAGGRRAVGRGDRRGDGVLSGVLALFLDGGALDGLGAEAALADEGLGGLVVDRGKGGEFREEGFEEDWGEGADGGGDGGFLGEDDALKGG